MKFAKNHDPEGDLSKLPGQPYLVQYRDFLPTVVSNFELHVRNGNEDTAEEFSSYARDQAKRWARFMKRWVDSEDVADRLIVKYEALTADPGQEIASVVRFFAPSCPVDNALIDRIVESSDGFTVVDCQTVRTEHLGTRNTRQIKAFRCCDSALFGRLEALAAEVKGEPL